MKIVHVCPYSWTARGGVQTHIRHLSRHLGIRGHDVLVLSAGSEGRGMPSGAGRSATTDIPSVHLVGSSIRLPFNGSVAPICMKPAGVRAVREALRQFRPDVVHVHEPLVPGVSLSAMWFATAPMVATFHAYCPPSIDAGIYSAAAWLLQPLTRRLSVRLAVSRTAASSAATRVGGEVRIVPNGIDIASFADAQPAALPPGRKLLFVGRLDRRKGFGLAVGAFARLCARFKDLQFLVVGDGPCRSALQSVSPEVRSRVVMLGDVDDDELPAIYAAADVFIAPAVGRESFGIVLLEAMAAGRPIVATDIDGYRDVVRANIDALVVEPNDERALADAIGRILDTPELAARLGRSARSSVQQFSWETVTSEVERAYSLAVESRAVDHVVAPVPVVGRSA